MLGVKIRTENYNKVMYDLAWKRGFGQAWYSTPHCTSMKNKTEQTKTDKTTDGDKEGSLSS